jgi:hypothetical protein
MDSNSHHLLWDSNTKTTVREADFALHDLLVGHPLCLITSPDVPTHLPSGNVIDLGFASPSLLWHISNVEVNARLGLGSDHLPITYELDLGTVEIKSNRFNPDAMDVDKFLAVLRDELDLSPLNIESQKELDEATDTLCDALINALNISTPRRRPSSHSKRWWTPELTLLLKDMKRKDRWYHRHLATSTRQLWLEARRALYRAIADAKELAWRAFVKDLGRVNVYDVLDCVRRHQRTVFPSLVDPVTGEVTVDHAARGRMLGVAWFGSSAKEVETGDGMEERGNVSVQADEPTKQNKNKKKNNNRRNAKTKNKENNNNNGERANNTPLAVLESLHGWPQPET